MADRGSVHDHRIAAAESLLAMAPETFRVQAALEPAALLTAAMHHRATKTMRGIVLLSRAGSGEQALMLSRSLFEDMVDMHWIGAEPEEAHRRFDEATWLEKVRQRRRLERHAHLLADDSPTAIDADFEARLTDEERVRLEKLVKADRYGSWTRLGLSRRVAAVEGQFGGGLDQALFELMRDAGEGLASDFVHSSVVSVYAQIDLDRLRAGGVAFHSGASDRHVAQALLLGSWAYVHALSVVTDTFGEPERPALAAAYERIASLYSTPSDDG